MALVSFLAAVDTKLKTLATRVYYGDVIDPTTPIPYTTWKYTSTIDVETMEDFIIEVEFTDTLANATRIETAVAAVDGDGNTTNPTGLNYFNYGAGGTPSFLMYRINRLALPAIDENILRRQLRYRVRVFSL